MAHTATSRLASPAADAETAARDFAPLDDDIIARQTDAGSFSRGKTYFRGKRIFNAVRRGDLLRARCRGSSGGPYHVEATLAPAGKRTSRHPVRYLCNCPRGGFCKHVVALLLTWIDAPETFEVRPPLADLLADKSREELVALVEAMVAANPDLEKIIALPPPIAIKPDAAPVDEAAIRRLIAGALPDPEDYDEYGGGYGQFDRYEFRYGYDGYDGSSYAAGELEEVVAYADAYIEGGHWRNAMIVSAVLAEQLPAELDLYQDEEGELASLISRTDASLAACLEAQERLPAEQRFSDEERTRLIDAILAIWEADIDAGGIDLSDGGPEAIGALATPAERERVREHLRGMILPAVGEPWKHQWHNRAVIEFLSLLTGEGGLSDDELLAE
ncbi:MAG: SWIM zinc finger family protein, partial [Thermomicrobiales bacterium]